MPQFAILPGTNRIAAEFFAELTLRMDPARVLPTIQTAMSFPGIIAVFAGVLSTIAIRYGLTSKKSMTVFGLSLIAFTGVVAILLNTRFWQLCLMNVLIGAGMGIFVPSAQSIMFDNFDEKSRQFISGVSFSCINAGGLIMSIICGFLNTIVWYGGHLQMLIAIPVIIVAFLIIPKDKRMKDSAGNGAVRTKIPPRVYYYAAMIVVFMIVYNVATINISTHLAQENLGDSSTAGLATALLMGGGVIAGLFFPKLSPVLRDYLFPITFFLLALGYSLINLFPASLIITLAAMFICGSTMSLLVPRCIFNVSNLSDPTNSATATMLVCCIAPGSGHFLSPIIITNLTMAIGGESTRFRFLFTAFVCIALAAVLLCGSFLQKRKAAA
jgi:MFS family permease